MCIDELNTMVALVLRYLYLVERYWPKTVACQHTLRGEFLTFWPPKPPKYCPTGMEFAKDRELRWRHVPTKFGVSRWSRSQLPGGGTYQPSTPLAGCVIEKGLTRRGLTRAQVGGGREQNFLHNSETVADIDKKFGVPDPTSISYPLYPFISIQVSSTSR